MNLIQSTKDLFTGVVAAAMVYSAPFHPPQNAVAQESEASIPDTIANDLFLEHSQQLNKKLTEYAGEEIASNEHVNEYISTAFLETARVMIIENMPYANGHIATLTDGSIVAFEIEYLSQSFTGRHTFRLISGIVKPNTNTYYSDTVTSSQVIVREYNSTAGVRTIALTSVSNNPAEEP